MIWYNQVQQQRWPSGVGAPPAMAPSRKEAGMHRKITPSLVNQRIVSSRYPHGVSAVDRILMQITVDPVSQCWEFSGTPSDDGYGRISIFGSFYRASRVMYVAEHGCEIPDGAGVCHTCDNPPCVNPAHLFQGSQLDNTQDCATKGRLASGERNGHCTISDAQVRQMFEWHEQGVMRIHIAQRLGVHTSTVSRILSGKRRAA